MVQEINQLSFNEVDVQLKFKKGTGYHKRLLRLARLYGMSPADVVRALIDADIMEAVKESSRER